MDKKLIILDSGSNVYFYINKNITAMYQGFITIYHAKTFSKFQNLIQNTDDIMIVVWGTFINDSGFETMHLIKQLKKYYKGIIIGLSEDRAYQKKLVRFGCNFACTLQAMPHNIARSFR